jgi:hypothetical protein
MRDASSCATESLWFGFGLRVLLLAIALVTIGCGSDPGGEFISGNVQNNQLPIAGAQQRLLDGFSSFKSGGYTAARDTFLQITSDSSSVATDKAEAYAGMGFCDVRLKGSQNGIPSFQQALVLDSKNQDARVGLAGALISRGATADIAQAIDLLQGIDPGNAEFVYTDKYGIGIKNAEVHALLAYALFVSGDHAGATTQMGIARRLDPNYNNTNVGQILNVISFIP